jgi:hypothetical protein
MRILTSTGRGGYVEPTKVSLEELLNRYDRCPAELIDEPRDAVIRKYEEAVRQIDELRGVVEDEKASPSLMGKQP